MEPQIEPADAIVSRNVSNIPGWASDADPENDPTYPMRDQTQDDGPGMNWQRPTQQPRNVELLMSNEHKRMPAVFGTTQPPKGLSGVLRRQAFRHSESKFAHWIMLMAADRVNMVEGVLEDLGRGRVPNLIDEYGLRAQWRYNRPQFVRRVATTAAVSGVAFAGIYYLMRSRRRERQRLEELPVAAEVRETVIIQRL
jgi:hypothetical protein